MRHRKGRGKSVVHSIALLFGQVIDSKARTRRSRGTNKPAMRKRDAKFKNGSKAASVMGRHMAHRSAGFFKVYAAIVLAIVLVAFAAHFMGTRLTMRIDDLDARNQRIVDPYEVAGVDLHTLSTEERPAADRISIMPDSGRSEPVATDENPEPEDVARITGVETFASQIQTKVSFEYPAGSKVAEVSTANGMRFTITDERGRRIVITHAKDSDGCFDPIRSFIVDPNSAADFRILYPLRQIAIDGKYAALRSDEEIGRFTYAGNALSDPLSLATNLCIQTAIPTRITMKSEGYKAGDKALLLETINIVITKMKI